MRYVVWTAAVSARFLSRMAIHPRTRQLRKRLQVLHEREAFRSATLGYSREAMRRFALGLVVLFAACGHLPLRKADDTVCPEYRDLVCVNGPVCTVERGRGCEVCECRKAL